MEGGIYVYIFGGNSKKLIGTECCIREMLCLKGENYLHCETQQFNLLTNVQLGKSFLKIVRGLPFILEQKSSKIALVFFKIFPIKIYMLLHAFEPIVKALKD